MLSSLASYLLGGGAAAAAETHSPAEALVPPAAVDADDGWVLVDNVEGSCADSTFVDLRLTVSAVTTATPTTGTTGQTPMSGAGARGRRRGSRVEPRPPTPVATPDAGDEGGKTSEAESGAAHETGPGSDAGVTTPAGLGSRSSSSASLPCLLVDESWYVTPPPCFTSTGPVHMETSPLEDLLIEHPSMSVYHQHPRAAPGPVPAISAPLPPPAPSPAMIAAAAATPSAAARPRAGSLPPPVPAPVAPPAARGAGALRLQEQQGLQLKTAQKVQQRRATQALKRGPLGRQNKARECNGRNKVLRRSDRMLQHSGANNNRKC